MAQNPLRIGLIGLDTSHAPAFTRCFNDAGYDQHVPGGRVVAAWPGGSKDFQLSWSRVEKFTAEIRDRYGVTIVQSPDAVAEAVDLLFISAADGRAHLPLFKRIVNFRRPTFIEKPLATSSADANEIFRIASDAAIAVVSCSTARFGDALLQALSQDLGPVLGCDVFGPMPEEATQPGLFWYGVHSLEVVNVIMGRGCNEVRAIRTDDADVMMATWRDGRVAMFRGLRKGEWKFGATIHRARGVQMVDLLHNSWFARTLSRVLADLPNGRTPVDPADTLEIIRMIEAA